MANKDKLIEDLSEAINSEWRYWSKDIAKKENLSKERMDRWQKLWNTPYSGLSEDMKEADRKWARKVIQILEEHGIILQECKCGGRYTIQDADWKSRWHCNNKDCPDYIDLSGMEKPSTIQNAVESLFSQQSTLTANEMCLLKNHIRSHINSNNEMDSETKKQHSSFLNNIDTKLDLMDFCYHLQKKYGIEAF